MRYYFQPSNYYARHHAGRPGGPSTIVASLLITGSIESAADLEIDGEIVGDVTCAALTIGKGATVAGHIRARQVVVRGRVAGSIDAELIILQHSARVEADLYQELLTIEEGAMFSGRSRPRTHARTVATAPLALASPAEAAA